MTVPALTRTPEAEQTFALATAILELEACLLGVLIGSPEVLAGADGLSADDLYEGAFGLHAQLLQAMRSAASNGAGAGLSLLQAQFGQALPTPAYLFDLVDKAPPATELPGLVQQVASGASQRRLTRLLSQPGLSAAQLQQIVQAEARVLDTIATRRKLLTATPYEWVALILARGVVQKPGLALHLLGCGAQDVRARGVIVCRHRRVAMITCGHGAAPERNRSSDRLGAGHAFTSTVPVGVR